MNAWLIAAAVLLVLVGAVHSVGGEILIFRRMRSAALIPTNGGTVLREPHVRILWATWHLVTILGVVPAAAMVWLALPENAALLQSGAPLTLGATMLAGALLVFVATKGKHLGWAGLLGVAALIGMGIIA